MAQINGISVGIDGDLSGFNKAIADMSARLGRLENDVNKFTKSVGGFESALSSAGGVFAGLFAVDKIVELGSEILDVTKEFQKLQAVLANTLGSQEAGAIAFAQISDFAAKTNFSVLELTDSYVKLANQGFKPTTAQLENLADVANSTGKSFDQLTEAIIDAQTGEFERLKEFGIQASKNGDQVTFAFKGIQTTVQNTNKSIRDYLVSLGDLEGVSGSTAAISQTLGGRISNLGDAFDTLFSTIGNQSSGFASKVVDAFTRIITATTNAIQSEEEYQKKLALRDQAKIQEGLPKEFKDLVEQYKNIGDSAEEATAKAKAFYEQSAGNQLKDLYNQLRDVDTQLKNVNESLQSDLSNPSNVSGFSVYKDQVKELTTLKAQIQGQIDVQKQYLNSVDEITTATKEAVQVTEEQKKALDKIRDTYADIFSKLEVANKKETLFGDDFQLGAERVKILQNGINSLLEQGLKPTSAEIRNLIRLLDQAEKMALNVSALRPNNTLNANPGGAKQSGIFTGEVLTPKVDINPLKAYENQLKLTEEQAKLLEQASQSTGIGISELGKQFISSGLSLNEYLSELDRLSQLADALSNPFEGTVISLQDLQREFENSGLSLDAFIEKTLALEEAKQQFDSLFQSLAASAASGLGDVVGNLLQGSDDAITVVRKFLAGIASQLALGLIAIGTPLLFTPATAAQGALYVAAGVALKAISVALGGSGSGSLGGGGSKPTVTTGFSNEDAGAAAKQDKTTVQVASASNVQGSTISRLFISGEFELVGGLQNLMLRLRETEAKEGRVGG